MTTHRNHYVPQWYQKRFVKGSKTPLYYLDQTPERVTLPTGEEVGPPAIQRNSPKNCFWAYDLYTTVFNNIPNDEIEKFLFGAIDNDGASALRAVVDGDLKRIHDLFQRFFEYLDAQKLRTPKGFDWIKSNYPKLTQLELLLEMQQLRQMHCTMWLEAVREIVSAEESDVKFLITDHPVTIYHAGHPPESVNCRYPSDPDIALKGSQTLFPLGPNHLLILTNLEYAQEPDRTDLFEPRQNARYFGRTMARVDAWIRTRRLARDDVISINYILKFRARRFIAAAEDAWLYPEKVASADWRAHGRVLLPPKKELWRFGGEIYVGFKDGTSGYHDAFGRTSRSYEYLQKDSLKAEPAPDELCRCGSGRTYEACCKDIESEDRMPSNVYSIRERNLMFFQAIEDILGLSRGKTWEDVRRELSDDQVRRIHTAYAVLWPRETNIAELLPRPDHRVFRALYVGLIDPRTIPVTVLGWLGYFDEIVLLNPFLNATLVRPEYSPIDSPGQHKAQTIKNVALMVALLPFIQAGVVHLIPDPMEFNDVFRDMIWNIAKQRVGSAKLSRQDVALAEQLGKDDLKRLIARLPDEDLRRQIRRSSPDLTEDALEGVIEHIRAEHAQDPLALIQPLVSGEEGGQLQQFRSTNFELAVFLAQLTGAAIYSDQLTTKNDLALARNQSTFAGQNEERATLERALRLKLTLSNDPAVTEASRQSSASLAFRSALRNLWSVALAQCDSPNETAVTDAIRQLEQLLKSDAHGGIRGGSTVSDETFDVVFDIDAAIVLPPFGYGLNAARRFLIAFGRRKHLKAIPLAILFAGAAGPAVA